MRKNQKGSYRVYQETPMRELVRDVDQLARGNSLGKPQEDGEGVALGWLAIW
jgi:hypothetical protein